MTKFFESFPSIINSKRVLELGSGTGLLGIALSLLGADVTLTDYYDLPLLIMNVEDNIKPPHKATVKKLFWYESNQQIPEIQGQ